MLHYNLVALVEIILANISLKEALFEKDNNGRVVLKPHYYSIRLNV
jgi:hypothetical protein